MKETIIERIVRVIGEKSIKDKAFCDEIGIAQSTFSNWKQRGTNPGAEQIPQIAKALGVSESYVLKGVEASEDMEVRRIERARGKMSSRDKEKMMKILEASFEEYFSDEFKDDDLDE